jgi:glycosyltransferase involved in cell wall biosynthesis
MKIILDLSFSIPIWRFFYSHDNTYDIPYEFIYKNKKYTNAITIIQFGWHINEKRLLDNNFLNENTMSKYCKKNVILCAPTQKTLELLKKYRPKFCSCLANHNAFIDENLYKINYDYKPKYDLIINSSLSKYKNLHLIKNLKNVCVIGYFTNDTNKKIMENIENKYCPNFENNERIFDNFKWLPPTIICEHYNMSKIGGIFSTTEGACFSSSEYLLCGLPVLSCNCEGGREIWYNDKNSIFCEDNEESVIKNLNLILDNYDKGIYDKNDIRNEHIKLMEVHRENLTNAILEVFQKITLDVPLFDDLKSNIKYYHSNCFECMKDSISYLNQNLKASQAREVLSIQLPESS